jgi:hypothetical protein
VFGTYSKASDFHTFVAKKWGVQSGPNSDIAKLRGASMCQKRKVRYIRTN